jgi:hypothetical protein
MENKQILNLTYMQSQNNQTMWQKYEATKHCRPQSVLDTIA